MKVIVIQGEAILLSMLTNAVNHFNPQHASEVIFTSFVTRVLQEAKEYEDVVIISGLKLHSMDGIELASRVKVINPGALFYLFSSVHKTSKDVNGHIFKYGGNEISLAKILAQDIDRETFKGLLEELKKQ